MRPWIEDAMRLQQRFQVLLNTLLGVIAHSVEYGICRGERLARKSKIILGFVDPISHRLLHRVSFL
jgi:hypothetical protein